MSSLYGIDHQNASKSCGDVRHTERKPWVPAFLSRAHGPTLLVRLYHGDPATGGQEQIGLNWALTEDAKEIISTAELAAFYGADVED